MAKGAFNIQDQVLNQSRKYGEEVNVKLNTGESFKAKVSSFDAFVVMFNVNGEDVMAYKSSISTVNFGAGFLAKCQKQGR